VVRGGQPELEAAPKAPVSPLAIRDGTLRRGAARTLPIYGVCVHTTGSGPATKAKGRSTTPLQIALDYYVHGGEGFPHYVIDYDGTIHAICDEGHVAWHAGWFARGGKQRWASWSAPAWWSSVWRQWNVATPAGLLPQQATDPNSAYIGVELLGDTSGWGFTNAQYDGLARLVVDVFRRQGVPLSEPPNPRLLGHEDLEPVDRANADGGWDPGAHRRMPKFSWAALWSGIRARGATGTVAQVTPVAPVAPVAPIAPVPGPAALASALGAAEAAAAFAGGERDADRLTDIVFHARHRERGGRPIAPSETKLVQEWLRIRDTVVLPVLRTVASAPPPVVAPAGTPPASAFVRTVPAAQRWALLVPVLDRYRGEIPLEFLLGWIAVESDGHIDVVTPPPLDERGFFQISRAESTDARPPLQHGRLSTDPDYSVQAGIQLVRFYGDLARRRFPWIPYGSELFWRVVKLQHAMGSGTAYKLLTQMRASGIGLTWDAIKRFEVTEGPKLAPILRVRPIGRFGHNVDRVFELGRASARKLGR
jgi:hypothetical protein